MGFQQSIETAAHLFFQAVEVPDYSNFDETVHKLLKRLVRYNVIILKRKSRVVAVLSEMHALLIIPFRRNQTGGSLWPPALASALTGAANPGNFPECHHR
jgi:hypothetical protein